MPMFLIYINDLANIINNCASPILFTDDTSIIVSSADVHEFKNNLVFAMKETLNWCQNNLLSIHLKKNISCDFQLTNRITLILI